ncbi:MAG: hypothetical protein ABI852_09075 [Gemmatimonadaceae bacterium]
MSIVYPLSGLLLHAATLQDTVVAKTMPAQLSWFDYTSGALQLIVLVLAVVVLGALAYMLVALKKGLDSLKTTVEKLYEDTRPIVTQAAQVTVDAREVVAMLRTDVERVTFATSELSEQLLDVAATTERRMDDINAVIDVVQGELEETVLGTAAALRGVRLGGRAIAGAMMPGRKKSGRAVSRDHDDDDAEDNERDRERDRVERNTAEHERELMDRQEARRRRRERPRRAGKRG